MLNASSARMSHALEQINAARIGVIGQKVVHQSSTLLACMVTRFLYGTSKVLLLFLGGEVRNTPDCPGSSNSYFALENET